MSHYVGRRRNALGASAATGLKGIATIPKATKQTTKQTLFACRPSRSSRRCLHNDLGGKKSKDGEMRSMLEIVSSPKVKIRIFASRHKTTQIPIGQPALMHPLSFMNGISSSGADGRLCKSQTEPFASSCVCIESRVIELSEDRKHVMYVFASSHQQIPRTTFSPTTQSKENLPPQGDC